MLLTIATEDTAVMENIVMKATSTAEDVLRSVTKPMRTAESEAMVYAQYGTVRENVSSDDAVALERARDLFARRRRVGRKAAK
jgi:hypothetical protein